MEIFGIGFAEIMLIMVVALIVFGPERLPEIAGKMGRMIADFRRMSTEVRREVSQELSLSEFSKLKQEVTDIASETRKEISQLKDEVAGVATDTRKEINEISSEVKATIAEQYTYQVENNPPVVTTFSNETSNDTSSERQASELVQAAVNAAPATAATIEPRSPEIIDPTAIVDLDSMPAPLTYAATPANGNGNYTWRYALTNKAQPAPTAAMTQLPESTPELAFSSNSTPLPLNGFASLNSVTSTPNSSALALFSTPFAGDYYFGTREAQSQEAGVTTQEAGVGTQNSSNDQTNRQSSIVNRQLLRPRIAKRTPVGRNRF